MNLKTFLILIIFGALLAYVDNTLNFQTMLVESVHAIVVTIIFVFCLICQYKYPEMKQVGWNKIVWGVGFLMVGSWVDILDDPPMIALIHIANVPFGRSWEQAFIKKILGYTGGIFLIAYGFFQWIPWMIETKLSMQKLNQKLGNVNKDMNRLVMSLEEHIESERLSISQELHDDIAQRLTFLNLQLQLCQKGLEKSTEEGFKQLKLMGQEITDTLKSVRQIARNLRPEPLYALGLLPALEQFIEKLKLQTPNTHIQLEYIPLSEAEHHLRIEAKFDELQLLHLFRILQEGIRNSLKHSQAAQIHVFIIEKPNQFEFIIEDNGVGLPWKVMPSDESLVQEGHLGVVGMKERIKELSGTFSLNNKPDTGARMEIIIAK
jgi:signal transduction histidine kinase